MALALYRKYRPAKFAEVVGQEHVTEPLSTALAAGRINHAYLFSGPRGCGKTSSARILARSLNCELGPTPDPCGVCPSCISLAPGGPGNIDVTELDAASHGGVDDTRELRDRAFFAPAESRYRVFIVDEAHMITTQGFNALLKIVEEPPEHLVFVFATTEPDKVLPTIRSRTHHYPFRLIPPGTLRKLLERICAEEGAVVAPPVFPLVIRAGGGSARDSLSVLDQLLAGAGPEGVTYERAVALLGVTDVSLIDDVVDALAASDRAAVFEAVDRLVEAGHDPRRFAADLLQRLRDLTLLQAVPEAAERGLVEGAEDELSRMIEQAGKLGQATLTRYGEIVHTGLTEMRGATAPRLLLELLCARMLLPAATVAEPGLLERLERLERLNAIASAPLPPGETVADREEPADVRPRFQRRSERAELPAGAGAPVEARDGRAGAAPAESEQAVPQRAATDRPAVDPRAAADSAAVPTDPGRQGGEPVAAEPAGAPPSGADRPAVDEAAGAGRRGGEPSTERQPGGRPAVEPAAPARPSEREPVARPGSARPVPERATTAASDRPVPPAPADTAARYDRGGPARQAEPAGVAPLDAAAVRRAWPEVLAAAKDRKKRTAALLVSATVRAVEGDTLVLSIGTAPLARLLSEQSNTEVIAESLHAVLGVRWRVRCEHGDAVPSAPPAAGPPPSPVAAPQRRPSRPPPVRRSAAPDDGEPLPPEPPEEEPPPDDEESMIAEAATAPVDLPVEQRRDPEEAAIELLSAQLGARAIDRR
ncbi:DNA polymerase III subunit gamma and tau [Pseudonocardia xinjiangensis]|uniref:DNA polymerase III subunit gamma and tau n=1 Tax=Pseudonocardia xinjiangensis TaxID=75289 RepID=UPI003D8EED0D